MIFATTRLEAATFSIRAPNWANEIAKIGGSMIGTTQRLAFGGAIAIAMVASQGAPATAQTVGAGQVCTTPTSLEYTPRDISRRFQPGQTLPDPDKKWHDAFMTAVGRCQKGDILVIEREVPSLMARLCDFEKPSLISAHTTRQCFALMSARNAERDKPSTPRLDHVRGHHGRPIPPGQRSR